MSRSYRKFPCVKDRNSCKWGKRQCNKRFRRTKSLEDIPNGSFYKKTVCKWDYLWDYKSYETWKSYKEWCEQPRWWKDFKEANYWDWYKSYKMK